MEERRGLAISLQRIRLRVSSYLESQTQLLQQLISRPVIASPYGFVDAQSEVLATSRRRIREILDFRLQRGEGEVKQLHAQARSLSPQLTLERGYSVVTDESGKPLGKITKSKKFVIRTSKQEISATADEVRDIK